MLGTRSFAASGLRMRAGVLRAQVLTWMDAFPLLPPEGASTAEDEEDEDVIFPLSPTL